MVSILVSLFLVSAGWAQSDMSDSSQVIVNGASLAQSGMSDSEKAFVDAGRLVAAPPAKSYFRLLDPKHVYQSARFLYDTHGIDPVTGVTDIAVVRHSTSDGTIVPQKLQKYIPPENWVPLSVGIGGNLKKEFVMDFGASLNAAPQVAALVFHYVDQSSPGWLQFLKSSFEGGGAVEFSAGWAELGHIVVDGQFQKPKEVFPGRGILEILDRAGRVSFGVAWRW